ncbi:atp-binding cassette sub-family b [Holotrichia oblita]|nr:atp-binding cassette sub-family b [Holotrichia oblita]
MLSGQKIVKAFSYEQTAQQRFDKINSELKDCGILAMFYSSLSNPAARFVNGIVYAAVAVTGAITAINNPLVFSVGALVSFLAYANQYSKPFTEVTGVLTELQSSLASLRRVIEILDAEQESDEKNLPSLKECNGDLKAENVCFSYDKSRPLIKNFNINIKKGMRVAIVGPTGCGKTTLINLLMRFYDIDSGRIAVWDKSDIPDGNDMPVDIKEVTRSSLRSHYGMVLQDTWLFKGTIKDNIAYGKQDATLEEITEAAKKSHIHGFISRLEHGYDTMLTEDGAPLSQGQKQLLTIARIMLTRPPMLILDEATSNIDTRTELHIQNAFKTMMKGRTSFIIAHRLSTIEDADLILVMNNGNIIESGTHKQLLTKGGFYANLFNSQFSV